MDAHQQFRSVFCNNDVAALRSYLAEHPELRQQLNAPIGPFDSPAIIHARTREVLDALLEFGADINAKSQWWAGGFGLLDFAPLELAHYAIQRGARLEAHSAARLGLLEELRAIVTANPSVVHAPGGDGKRPLHFARNVEIAKFLLDHGAEIDALDIDHESTAAQHLIGEHQDVVRYLVQRGAKTDIFLAAALGDLELVQKHLAEDPNSICLRINSHDFPMSNARAGGTIYTWTLGSNLSPHQVARKFGHHQIRAFLLTSSPPDVQLMNYLEDGDGGPVMEILEAHPDMISKLPETARRAPADAARDRRWPILQHMLNIGFPIDARGQHEGTPLHWAAWHGSPIAVADLLRRGAPLEVIDADFKATPLQWCLHGSENGWHRKEGDYPGVAKLLLQAGAKLPAGISGTEAVREAIRQSKAAS